jgi:hypothetical protein
MVSCVPESETQGRIGAFVAPGRVGTHDVQPRGEGSRVLLGVYAAMRCLIREDLAPLAGQHSALEGMPPFSGTRVAFRNGPAMRPSSHSEEKADAHDQELRSDRA